MTREAIPLDIDEKNLDELPFGVIKIDGDGTILQYNAFESQLSGRSKNVVVGRNFFMEIAPCTNVSDFYGRFLEAKKTGAFVNLQFPFLFSFDSPREVFIHVVSGSGGTFWIFVSETVRNRGLQVLLDRERANQERLEE